jgi:hypothetical protein
LTPPHPLRLLGEFAVRYSACQLQVAFIFDDGVVIVWWIRGFGTEADAVTLTLKQVDGIVPPLSMLARTTALRSQAPAAFGWKPAHPNPLAAYAATTAGTRPDVALAITIGLAASVDATRLFRRAQNDPSAQLECRRLLLDIDGYLKRSV